MKIQSRPAGFVLSFLALTLFLSSCQFVVRTVFGISMPKHESEQDQIAWLKKKKLSTDNIYRLKREYADSNKFKTYSVIKPYNGDTSKFSLVQFRFFSLKDNYTAGWAICLGDLEKSRLLDSFPIRKHGYFNPYLKLEPSLRMLETNDGRSISPEILKGYDYVLIAFWGKFFGRLANNRMLQQLEKYVADHKDKKILFLKVNIANAAMDEEEGPAGK